jgi:Lysyl oxidase
MRWLVVAVLMAAGGALGFAGLLLLRGDPPRDLLPDLDQAVPSALSIVQEGDQYRLTFASAVDNLGRGPLLVEGRRPDRLTPVMAASQLVRRSDGSARTRAVRAEIRYVRAETHAHWHVLDFERYELRRAKDGKLVEPDEKTGFCLGDRYDAKKFVRLENEPERPVWSDECGRYQPGLLTVREGISPGYGDDYVPELEGQYLDVTTLSAGRYILVHRANPERALEERDYGNNAASVLVQLRRTTGDVPTLRLLARCPDTARCG